MKTCTPMQSMPSGRSHRRADLEGMGDCEDARILTQQQQQEVTEGQFMRTWDPENAAD